MITPDLNAQLVILCFVKYIKVLPVARHLFSAIMHLCAAYSINLSNTLVTSGLS